MVIMHKNVLLYGLLCRFYGHGDVKVILFHKNVYQNDLALIYI